MDLLEQRAYRTLRHMEPYLDLTSSEVVSPSWIRVLMLHGNERLIGAYVPVAGEPTENIVVSTRGLHIESKGAWIFIGYEQLADISIPKEFWDDEGKLRMNRLMVTLIDGRVVQIPIRKHHWKFSDVPEFARFLIDVRSDVRRGKIQID